MQQTDINRATELNTRMEFVGMNPCTSPQFKFKCEIQDKKVILTIQFEFGTIIQGTFEDFNYKHPKQSTVNDLYNLIIGAITGSDINVRGWELSHSVSADNLYQLIIWSGNENLEEKDQDITVLHLNTRLDLYGKI